MVRPTPLRPLSDPGNNLETRQKRGSLKVCLHVALVCGHPLFCSIFSVLVLGILMWCIIRSIVLLLLSKTLLPLMPSPPHRATPSSGRSPAVIQAPLPYPLDLVKRASLVISQRYVYSSILKLAYDMLFS